jgi:hypothetical protein
MKKNIIAIFLILVLILFVLVVINFIPQNNVYNIFTIKQKNIDEIVLRFDNNTLTENDKKTLNNIYRNIIFFGGFIYPEASKILKHYIFGNGDDLIITSKYFFESKFIINTLNKNQNIEIIGPITLKIKENPRIAYAVNGFYINKNDPMEIYQKIIFASRKDRNTYTSFDILNKKLNIPDRLVRAFEADGGCNKFTVRIRNR